MRRVPRRRATKFLLRSFGPKTCTSLAANPASRKRFAMASAATVVLPTESVVLISMSCLKMSRESRRVASSVWAKKGRRGEGQNDGQEHRGESRFSTRCVTSHTLPA